MSFHAARFGRAARTYASHAEVQPLMADKLLEIVRKKWIFPLGSSPRLLEMGCGTGVLTEKLLTSLPQVLLFATDASMAMLDEAKKKFVKPKTELNKDDAFIEERLLGFSILDASAETEVASQIKTFGPFAGVASNALVQWFPHLVEHLSLVAGLLEPKGFYLVSGFTQENFSELNALLKEPPFHYSDFPGHGKEEVNRAAIQAGFEMVEWQESTFVQTYSSAEAFLASISGLGSARRPEAVPLTRSRLIYLVDQYHDQNAVPEGVKATWKPWYALMRKRPNPN